LLSQKNRPRWRGAPWQERAGQHQRPCSLSLALFAWLFTAYNERNNNNNNNRRLTYWQRLALRGDYKAVAPMDI
jgi:hypothetical protein